MLLKGHAQIKLKIQNLEFPKDWRKLDVEVVHELIESII